MKVCKPPSLGLGPRAVVPPPHVIRRTLSAAFKESAGLGWAQILLQKQANLLFVKRWELAIWGPKEDLSPSLFLGRQQ